MMTTVRFTQDFDFVPPGKPTVCIAYKAGTTKTVTRECADRAILAGKAEEVAKPRKVAAKKVETEPEVHDGDEGAAQ